MKINSNNFLFSCSKANEFLHEIKIVFEKPMLVDNKISYGISKLCLFKKDETCNELIKSFERLFSEFKISEVMYE